MHFLRRKNLITIVTVLCAFNLAYCQDPGNNEKAEDYYQRGNALYEQGKYPEAEAEFQKAMELLKTGQNTSIEKGAGNKLTQEAIEKAEPEKIVSKEDYFDRKNTPTREYIIGEEDVLQVNVWQNTDLSQDVIVRPDGKISFPLLGDIQASGLTIGQLTKILTAALKEYVRFPQVSISLKKMGGSKVVVLGEVAKPGVYSVTGTRTVLEAIGLAGGLTSNAVPSSTVIIRGGFMKPQAKRINLSLALKGDARQNIALSAEDIIFIPKKFIADLNYFLSQILGPLSKGTVDTQVWKQY